MHYSATGIHAVYMTYSRNIFAPVFKRQEAEAFVPVIVYNSIYYFSIASNTSSVTPVNENPPSWKRFCMVTILERSLNKDTQ